MNTVTVHPRNAFEESVRIDACHGPYLLLSTNHAPWPDDGHIVALSPSEARVVAEALLQHADAASEREGA